MTTLCAVACSPMNAEAFADDYEAMMVALTEWADDYEAMMVELTEWAADLAAEEAEAQSED